MEEMLRRNDPPGGLPGDLRSELADARAGAHRAVEEHHHARRSVYFSNGDGQVFERTPDGQVYSVIRVDGKMQRTETILSNVDISVRRIRLPLRDRSIGT